MTAQAADYRFTVIADTSGHFSRLGPPVLNNEGVVAFPASLDPGVVGIFSGNGGPTVDIARSDRRFYFSGLPPIGINDSGAVAFIGTHREQGLGVFRAGGGNVETIASVGRAYSDFDGVPAISGDGRVAFFAYLNEGGGTGAAIFLSDGLKTVALARRNTFENPTKEFMNPRTEFSINDESAVAFVAATTGHCKPDEFWCEPKPTVFVVSAGRQTKVADTSGPFSGFLHVPAINARGQVAFRGHLDEGGHGIFIAQGTTITRIADTTGPYKSVGHPSISNSGVIAFWATLDDGGVGVFTGPDPVKDKVVTTGDAMIGSKVDFVDLTSGSVNDRGQVAFLATLEDGRHAIVRADPAGP